MAQSLPPDPSTTREAPAPTAPPRRPPWRRWPLVAAVLAGLALIVAGVTLRRPPPAPGVGEEQAAAREGGVGLATPADPWAEREAEVHELARRRPSPAAGMQRPPATPPEEPWAEGPEALPPGPPPAPLPPSAEGPAPQDGVTPPRLERLPSPAYPAAARRLRREADVTLRLQVDARGRVTRAEPLGPPAGLGFDEAARRAALRARYRPATRGGAPIPMETTLTVRFRLD
ncbi:MAG TPA: TonB family protein [Thermoanaerobaculia bacterium]|nr:TonB family protein [Thermoanaerobaculia bacterium]